MVRLFVEQPSPGRVAVVLYYAEGPNVTLPMYRNIDGHGLTSFRRVWSPPTVIQFPAPPRGAGSILPDFPQLVKENRNRPRGEEISCI